MIDYLHYVNPEMLMRLAIAAVLGLAIGLERELKGKALGLKTILVISIISCLLTIVSIQASYEFPFSKNAEIRMDPLRLAAQIVSGVGFLGAGVILRRGDDTISGLTTAALVWGAAGIGIAVGAGFYVEATVGVVLLLISVQVIPFIVRMFNVKRLHLKELYLRVTVKDREDIHNVIVELNARVYHAENIRIQDMDDGSYLVVLLLNVREDLDTATIYNKIAEINQIETIELRA